MGTVVSALATSLALAITGRVLQGVGGAISPLASGITRDNGIATSIGLISGVLGVGTCVAAIGASAAGILQDAAFGEVLR